jgi:hypothetical protein
MKLPFFILIAFCVIICSCQKNIDHQPNINGVWQSIGSGWLLEIKDSTQFKFYDITSISCLPSTEGPFDEIASSINFSNDTLSLKKGVITYFFTGLEELPLICSTHLEEEKINDPIHNFEIFATTVKDHYAFMELNNINWNSLYQKQKSKIQTEPTNINLYQIIDETLEELNDNHAYLEADEKTYQQLDKLEEQNTKEENIPSKELKEYGDFQIAEMVTQHHLEEEYTKDSWLIKWGRLKDSIGYMQVKAMWLYADLDIPQELIDSIGYVDAYVTSFHQLYEGNYIEKEVMGARKIMKQVMKDLKDMSSIVIDVRFNGGGQDAVSFEILSHFINRTQKVATQKLRHLDTFSPTITLSIEGKPNPYTKPIYILTSAQTGSAAEAFSIASMSLPNVHRIGTPTAGAMSTALEKRLPNGWAFSISNEIYMDLKGNVYENKGIPVNAKSNYPRDRQTFFRNVANDLEKDKLEILEAIEKLNQ